MNTDFSLFPKISDNKEFIKGNDDYIMGVLKLIFQTYGVNLPKTSTPINSDSAGVYFVIRDNLSKKEIPIYAHRANNGYEIREKQNILNINGKNFILEFERPYFSFNYTIDGIPFRDICNIEYDGHFGINRKSWLSLF